MRRRHLIAVATLAAVAAPLAAASHTEPAGWSAILAGPQRSDAHRARDAYRNPAKTLDFFGIKPTMTVVEVSPSAGYYAEILAPYLRDKGRYIAAHNNPAASERAAASVKRFQDKLAATPAVYDKVTVTAFGKDAYDLAPAGSADAVLTFRNVHNWTENGFGPQAFAAFNRALKKGGTLGVVEHRLPESRPDAQQGPSGYMKTSTVVKLAEAAGFKLVGQSEINANAKDTADWPKGVWTLPPNFAEGEATKAKYQAIGESDRMTLKFEKARDL